MTLKEKKHIYYILHREERLEQQKRYNQENKEAVNYANKKYYERNKEKILARQRQRYWEKKCENQLQVNG